MNPKQDIRYQEQCTNCDCDIWIRDGVRHLICPHCRAKLPEYSSEDADDGTFSNHPAICDGCGMAETHAYGCPKLLRKPADGGMDNLVRRIIEIDKEGWEQTKKDATAKRVSKIMRLQKMQEKTLRKQKQIIRKHLSRKNSEGE